MTLQEIFNKVVTHLRQQGVKALNEDGGCVYNTPQGEQCAVGCLIPNREYRSTMEGKGVAEIFDKYSERPWVKNLKGHLFLLKILQEIHDDFEPEEWEEKFKCVAAGFDLVLPKKGK